MRKSCTFLVLSALVAALGGAAAAPAHAAAPPGFSYSSTGITADAFFSDAPADGNLVPRTTYHDTFISASQSATRSDGTTSQGSFAIFDQYSYSIDRHGDFVFLGERFGYAEGVDFSADKKLTQAALSATLPVDNCDANYDCVAGGTQQVSVTWTGYGTLTRVRGTNTVHNRTLHYTERWDGTSRQASASTTGLGDQVYASLFSGKNSGRCMGEGCFF